MTSCKNCFLVIEDLRKETRCATCNAPLHKDCAIKTNGASLCDVCYTVNSESIVEQLVEGVVPDVIRRSYIELYKQCPYSFYLQVIKGIETDSSSYATIGIDLHELFHQASLGKIRTSGEMIHQYSKQWYEYPDSMFESDIHLYRDMTVEQLREKLKQQTQDAIETFFQVLSTLPSTAYALEQQITFPVGDNLPKVCITMDRIDEVDGQLEVRDWKTGAVIVGKKLSSDLQAPLYIHAVQHEFKMPVRKFVFNYLPENKVRTFERINDDNYVCTVNKREYKINITDAIREVQAIFAQIKKGNFQIPRETRNMYFTCKTCHFKKCGTCQGADVESWQQYNKGGS